MLQLKIFSGTLAEVEHGFNMWGAGLRPNTQVMPGPLMATGAYNEQNEALYTKEVMYQLQPGQAPNGVVVPSLQLKDLPK